MRSSPLSSMPPELGLVVLGLLADRGAPFEQYIRRETVASVGDKPLPIVAGEPGAVASCGDGRHRSARTRGLADFRAESTMNAESPCPTCKVRLAVGGAAGGKAVGRDDGSIGSLHASWSAFRIRRIPSSRNMRTKTGPCPAGCRSRRLKTDVRIALQASRWSESRTRLDPAGTAPDRADLEHRFADEESSGRDWRRIGQPDQCRRSRAASRRSHGLVSRRQSGRRRGRLGTIAAIPLDRAGTPPGRLQSGHRMRVPTPRAHDESAESTDRAGLGGRSSDDGDDDGPNPLPPAIGSGATSSIRSSACARGREPGPNGPKQIRQLVATCATGRTRSAESLTIRGPATAVVNQPPNRPPSRSRLSSSRQTRQSTDTIVRAASDARLGATYG